MLLDGLLCRGTAGSGRGFVDFSLDIPGLTELTIAFRDEQVGLAGLVPMARQLSDVTIAAVLGNLERQNIRPACRKGCHAACCHHLLVSLSVPEAFAMIEKTALLPPEQGDQVVGVCRKTAQRIRDQLRRNPQLKRYTNASSVDRDSVLDWYMALDMACPFLKDNCCSIYRHRPIACRECLVVSPASHCRRDDDSTVSKVYLPVRIVNVLTQLAAELFGTPDEMIALPCAFDWFAENKQRYARKWPAEFLVRRFVEIALEQRRNMEMQNKHRLILKEFDRDTGNYVFAESGG